MMLAVGCSRQAYIRVKIKVKAIGAKVRVLAKTQKRFAAAGG
jgi:hypothetical protein